MIIAQGQRSAAAAERVDEILDTAPVIVDNPHGDAAAGRRARRAGAARCASRACGSPTRPSCRSVLDGFDLAVPAGRVGRPGRRHRQRQDHRRPADPALLRRRRRRASLRRRRRRARPAAAGRCARPSASCSRTRSCSPTASPPTSPSPTPTPSLEAIEPAARLAGAARVHRARCPRATTPRSASGASRCRAASASASPSPGRSSPTRGC